MTTGACGRWKSRYSLLKLYLLQLQGMEKLLLERLLVRKELRLTAMQEKVLMQSISQTFNQSINCPIDDVINLSRWRVEMQGILVECIF